MKFWYKNISKLSFSERELPLLSPWGKSYSGEKTPGNAKIICSQIIPLYCSIVITPIDEDFKCIWREFCARNIQKRKDRVGAVSKTYRTKIHRREPEARFVRGSCVAVPSRSKASEREKEDRAGCPCRNANIQGKDAPDPQDEEARFVLLRFPTQPCFRERERRSFVSQRNIQGSFKKSTDVNQKLGS